MTNWPEYLIFDINELARAIYPAASSSIDGHVSLKDFNDEFDYIIDNMIYAARHKRHIFSLLNDFILELKEGHERLGDPERGGRLALAISRSGYKLYNLLEELRLYDENGKMHYAYSGRIGYMSIILTRFL